MNKILFLIFFILVNSCTAETIAISDKRKKILIIDSGISLDQSRQSYMCRDGLITTYEFDDGLDEMGHGTNIVSLIAPSINTKTTCLVSIKVFSSKDSVLMGNMGNYLNALKTASEINPKFVNISMEGESSSKAEYFYIYKMLKNGSIISVAAGNGHKDLSVNCDVFPACYKKIMPKKLSNQYNVVASPTTNSNFGGIINVYLDGKNKGIPLKSGSSQATAIMTASLVSE